MFSVMFGKLEMIIALKCSVIILYFSFYQCAARCLKSLLSEKLLARLPYCGSADMEALDCQQ